MTGRRYPHTTQVAAKLSDDDLGRLDAIVDALEERQPSERHKAVTRSDGIRAALQVHAADIRRHGDPTWIRLDVDVAAQLVELARRMNVDLDGVLIAMLNAPEHPTIIRRELDAMLGQERIE